MRQRFGSPAEWVGSALLLFLCAAPRPGIHAVQAKSSWTVELNLAVQGQYRMDDKAGPRVGHYSFAVRWKGTIEEDEDDFSLLHDTTELLDWRADESPARSGEGRFLTTDDFSDKPVFHFNYVLKENEEIQLDFAMDGFSIPLNPSTVKFPLVLPSSAASTRPGAEPGYDKALTRGSNRIRVPLDGLKNGRLDNNYAWGWKRYQTGLAQDTTVSCLQSHEVRLFVSFTPDKKR